MSDSELKGQHTALPWWDNAEEYAEVLSMLPASENDPPITYNDWLKLLEKCEKVLLNNGMIPIRVPVDPAALKAWCDREKKRVCRDSMSAFVMMQLGKQLHAGRNN